MSKSTISTFQLFERRARCGPGYRRTINRGLTLEQAQAHCSDINTSSSTAWTTSAINRTKRYGPWFDAYEEEK